LTRAKLEERVFRFEMLDFDALRAFSGEKNRYVCDVDYRALGSRRFKVTSNERR